MGKRTRRRRREAEVAKAREARAKDTARSATRRQVPEAAPSGTEQEPGGAERPRARTEAASLVDSAKRFARPLAACVGAGLIAGFLVGGIGARIAMRVLAVTSPNDQGALTENQNVIGEVTLGGTASLLIAGTVTGAIGGAGYGALRRFLPRALLLRASAFGLVLFALLGGLVLNTRTAALTLDGREIEVNDFGVVEPAWLAVLLFGALFPLYALVLVPLAERFLPAYPEFGRDLRTIPAYAPLVVLVPFQPLLLGVVIVGFAARAVEQSPRLLERWRRPGVVTAVRLGLAAATALGLSSMAGTIGDIV